MSNDEARLPVLPDTGCHLHPHCLSCPRPRCIHDEPDAITREKNAASRRLQARLTTIIGSRNTSRKWGATRDLVRELMDLGITSPQMIGQVLGLGVRTVHRHKAAIIAEGEANRERLRRKRPLGTL